MESMYQTYIDKARNLSLLFVEDNRGARAGSMLIFEEFFGSVIEAKDGIEGLEKFQTQKIDLVITDINMPTINGLEMAESIRKISPHTPILILSAYNETDYFMESLRLGIEGYLLKPVEIGQFLEVLGRVIEKIYLREENQKIEMLFQQYVDITDKSAIVSKADINGTLTYVNDGFCQISGYAREEIVGKKYNIMLHKDMPLAFLDDLWNTINRGEFWQGIIKNRAKNGNSYYTKTAIKPICNNKGEVIEFMTLYNDITEVMNPKKQLFDYINIQKEVVVVLFRIEDFPTIEQFCSHELIEIFEHNVADKILENIQDECPFEKIYTLGLGEYALAIDKNKCPLSATMLTQKLKSLLKSIESSIFHLNEIEYGASLIASLSYGGKDPFQSAHFGLKKAEKEKKNFIIATDFILEMQKKAQSNMNIILSVKKALNTNGIISYFQPIVDNQSRHIVKFESLVRLIDDNLNLWFPSEFLDVSKKGRYYTQITQRVLENSFGALYETNAGISINLSAADIEENVTRTKLISLLEQHSQYAHRITFELLEDANVKEFDVIKHFIKEVKSRGVSIAIDDFGSGYSNFIRLLDYEPDIIKIDGSLIKNITTDYYARSIVKTIINFANEHAIKTVAEFVETEETYKMLCDLGVQYSQGFYFSEPKSLDAYQGIHAYE